MTMKRKKPESQTRERAAAGRKTGRTEERKVILISGSPRKKGNTAQVVAECARVIKAAGVKTEVISFSGRKIESCIACYRCAGTGRCILDDGLNGIIEKVRESQGLIIASPVYFGSARGDVMNALQRIGMCSMAHDGFLSGKVGGPIAIARRGGHTATLQEMLMFFLMNEMIVVGSTYWNMVFGREPGEVWKDDEGIATIRVFAENVAELIKKIT